MSWKSTPTIFIISVVTIFVIAKLLARLQKKRLRLAYSKRNPLMSDFVKKSRIATIQFEPFTFGITPLMQTIAYLLYELFQQKFYPEKFDREYLTLPDGGTVGLDWDANRSDPEEKPDKPILLMVPGVAGDSDNMYEIALMREVREKFNVVILLLRGASGLPITSGTINHVGCWRDIKHAVVHVYKKNCSGKRG